MICSASSPRTRAPAVADGATIDDGMAEFGAAIDALSRDVAAPKEMIRAGLDTIQANARRRAPKQTGALADDIETTMTGSNSGTVTSDIVYAKRQHFVVQRGRPGFLYLYRAAEDDSTDDLERDAERYLEGRITKRLRKTFDG